MAESSRCLGVRWTCGPLRPLFEPRRSRPPAGWPTSRSTTRTSTSTSTTSTGECGRRGGSPRVGRGSGQGPRPEVGGRVRVAARGGSVGACGLPFPALCSRRPGGTGAAGSALPRPPPSGRDSPGLWVRPGGSGPGRRGRLRRGPGGGSGRGRGREGAAAGDPASVRLRCAPGARRGRGGRWCAERALRGRRPASPGPAGAEVLAGCGLQPPRARPGLERDSGAARPRWCRRLFLSARLHVGPRVLCCWGGPVVGGVRRWPRVESVEDGAD